MVAWDEAVNHGDLVRSRTRSDEHGRFALDHIPPGDIALVAMADDGRTGHLAMRMGAAGLGDLVVALSPRRTIRGRVVDQAGTPIADCKVRPSPLEISNEGGMSRFALDRTVTTTTDGSFVLVGLDRGRWHIDVMGPRSGYAPSGIDVLVTDDEPEVVELTMKVHTAHLRGTVLGRDGAPAMGLTVHASTSVHYAQTDRHGAFSIQPVAAGTYRLVITGESRKPLADVAEVLTGSDVTITIPPACSLTVRASRDGMPARSVSVCCNRPSHGDFAENVAGTHTFLELLAGEYEVVAFGPEGVAAANVRVDGESAIDLALEDFASVTGVLVDAITGAPRPHHRIQVEEAWTDTDADGRFELRVCRGERQIALGGRATQCGDPPKIPYRARPGEHVDLGRIVFPPPAD